MDRRAHHTSSGLSVALLAAALTAAARADIPPGWPVTAGCGTTVAPSSIKLEASLDVCYPGTEFQLTAQQAGTLTFDIHLGSLGTAVGAGFTVYISNPGDTTETPIFGAGFCEQDCSYTAPGFAVPVVPGSVIHGRLDVTYLILGGPVWFSLEEIDFQLKTGFFDQGDDLDASVIHTETSGQPLVMLSDIDGDGGADYAFNDSGGLLVPAPLVRVASGSSGAVISQFPGQFGAGSGAWLADVGDIDGDGLDDIAVGEPLVMTGSSQGRVRVRSAATGVVLLSVPATVPASEFGSSVGAPGDVNLDGVPDLLVGAPKDDTAGSDEGAAWLLSGTDGHVLLPLAPPGPTQSTAYGTYVQGAGDVDADGGPDLIVRTSSEFLDVHVRRGSDGATLHLFQAESPAYPHCVAAGADLDLDGHADVVVGRPAESGGSVHAFSGADGRELWSVDNGTKFLTLGAAIAALGDVDGDGVIDLIVGRPGEDLGLGRAQVLSGSSGATLYDSAAPANLFGNVNYGLDLDAGGDVDGDGTPDALVLAPPKHQLVVLSGSPADNVAPQLAGTGDLAAGGPAALTLTQGVPGGTAALVIGFTEYFVPFKGGFLEAKPDAVLPLVLDLRGAATLLSHLPAGVPPGFTFWLQSWHPDSGGLQGYKASNTLMGLTK